MKEKTGQRSVWVLGRYFTIWNYDFVLHLLWKSGEREKERENRMVLNQKTASISMDFWTTFELWFCTIPSWSRRLDFVRFGEISIVGFASREMNGDDTAAPSAPPPPQLEWKFSQVFGERAAGEEVQEGIVGFLRRWIRQLLREFRVWFCVVLICFWID